MFAWIQRAGYDQADIAALRGRHPGMRSLRSWLRESAWRPSVAV